MEKRNILWVFYALIQGGIGLFFIERAVYVSGTGGVPFRTFLLVVIGIPQIIIAIGIILNTSWWRMLVRMLCLVMIGISLFNIFFLGMQWFDFAIIAIYGLLYLFADLKEEKGADDEEFNQKLSASPSIGKRLGKL
jgi:hypothetical protein